MGLFSDGFKELKKASEPIYKSPKSIQETIEIMEVSENGIFKIQENKYSKTYKFMDINYTTATYEEQEEILQRYCKFLNSLDCSFKITINNKNKDMEDLRRYILLPYLDDGFDRFRKIYNNIIEEKIKEGRQGIEQEKYLTITVERKNFEEAKAQFATIEVNVKKAFNELGTGITSLSGNERLRVLHDFYNLGKEDEFDFNIREAKRVGRDFRNDLCNGMIKFYQDYFEDENKVCRSLFFKKYPKSLSEELLNTITMLPVHMITSIDVVPIPKDMTIKLLQKKYLGVESDIIKQQRVRNKNNDFSTEISYSKRMEKKDIEDMMTNVRENDEKNGQAPTITTKQDTPNVKKPAKELGRTTVKSAIKKKSAGKVKVSVKKVKGAKKYQIQIAKTKKFKKVLVNKIVKKTTVTIKNKKLKNKKKLFVRAKAVGASKWSKVKKVKIK